MGSAKLNELNNKVSLTLWLRHPVLFLEARSKSDRVREQLEVFSTFVSRCFRFVELDLFSTVINCLDSVK